MYTVFYGPGDMVGYYDIVEENIDKQRTEEVVAEEDTYCLYLNKI
jgi:hypothetical protein